MKLPYYDCSKAVNLVTKFMYNTKLRPGDKCPITGKYLAFTPSGDPTYTAKDMECGKRLPPTPFSGCYYQLITL